MPIVSPFPWRPLTTDGALVYCLDPSGALLLRQALVRQPAMPPLEAVRWPSGEANPLDTLGFEWTRAANGDGWMLHSATSDFARDTALRWHALLAMAGALSGVDERILSAVVMSDGSHVAPSADGLVHDIRTLPGYPERHGDDDQGDELRDAVDFAATGGTQALHGLTQMTIAGARAACPELFEGLAPAEHRARLADPVCALACRVKRLATFEREVRADPVRLRIGSALGPKPLTSVRTAKGSSITDGARVLTFVAAWNDDVIARALPPEDAPSASLTTGAAARSDEGWLGIKWLYWAGAAGVAAVGLGGAKVWLDGQEMRRADEEEDQEDGDDAGGFVLVPAAEAPRLLAAHTASQTDDEDEDEEGDEEDDDEP